MTVRDAIHLAMFSGAPILAGHAVGVSGTARLVTRVTDFASRDAWKLADRVDSVGRHVTRALGRPASKKLDRPVGAALVATPLMALVSPYVAIAVFVLLTAFPMLQSRREARQRDDVLRRTLPEIVDLYSVALTSGHNIAMATVEVAQRSHGLAAVALANVTDRMSRGQPIDVSLEGLSKELGPRSRPLTAVLIAGLRYGVPVAESLVRVAHDMRLERRRVAEQAARRLPVTMLFPLVLCVLPAFGLLTVVPVLLDSLQALSS